jgi:fructosamine-3-kinase
MIPESLTSSIESYLRELHDKTVKIQNQRPLGGGSINDTYLLETDEGSYFLKYNDAARFPGMFEKEARGLSLMYGARTVKVPEVVQYATAGSHAYLLLEYIAPGRADGDFWEKFGKDLAEMHQKSNDYFGLDHDNYMGSLYQNNTPHEIWSDFFIDERLERQVKLARDEGSISKSDAQLFDKLYPKLSVYFPPEPPAIVHGDLWSGNYIAAINGKAYLIDPAAYYGHREVDIAMSTLFGKFDADFYRAYNEAYPMESGWEERLDIYNLYPLMVHVNLFGGGYWGSVKSILNRFV